MTTLLEARGVAKAFQPTGGLLGLRSGGSVQAVERADVTVRPGECVALVGESGSGKTTLGRCLLRLVEPDAGIVRFRGDDLLALGPGELRRKRRAFQMVFQDPFDSLSPRMRVGEILTEPLAAHGLVPRRRRRQRAVSLLETVDLPASSLDRYAHELSGGERQRVGIARALATEPDLLVADEPVSALDVLVRGQVLELFRRLREELGLGILLIAHDLAMVERVADRVLVMRAGRIVEESSTAALFARPAHPYTAELLRSVPRLPPDAWPVGR